VAVGKPQYCGWQSHTNVNEHFNHTSCGLVDHTVFRSVRAIDGGHVAALSLVDLSSAFDSVDHSTLLSTIHVLRHRAATIRCRCALYDQHCWIGGVKSSVSWCLTAREKPVLICMMDELFTTTRAIIFDRKDRFEMGRKELRFSGFNDSFFRRAVNQACLWESGNNRIVVTRCRWWVRYQRHARMSELDRRESALSLVATMFVLLLMCVLYFNFNFYFAYTEAKNVAAVSHISCGLPCTPHYCGLIAATHGVTCDKATAVWPAILTDDWSNNNHGLSFRCCNLKRWLKFKNCKLHMF